MIILLIIVIILALIFIIPLFTKKEYTIEREATINKPKFFVFNYIKQLKNQDNYSVWAKYDPNMKKEYKGVDGTVGFVAAWDSENKKAGKGEQEITNVVEGEKIDTNLHFIKPFEGRCSAYMTTNATSENQTAVKWCFNGKMKYPMNIMLLFMNMEKAIGNDLTNGLSNLKTLLEK